MQNIHAKNSNILKKHAKAGVYMNISRILLLRSFDSISKYSIPVNTV